MPYKYGHTICVYTYGTSHMHMVYTCHTKIGPPTICPAGLILAEKPAKIDPLDHFCCQNRPPHIAELLFMGMHDCMDV